MNNYGMSEPAQESQIIEAMDENYNQNLHSLEGATVMAMREVLTQLLGNSAVEEIEELGNETDPEMPPLLGAADEVETEEEESHEEDDYEDEDEDEDDLDTDVNDSDLFGSDTDGEEIFETPSTIHISQHTGFEETKTPDISPRALFARGEEQESEEEEEEEEEPMCSVCYETLTIKNIVNTKCNHTFCKKCFYRWIEVNATCPQCRDPIDSHTTLTDEQIARECTEIYTNYRTNLKDWSRNMKRNKRLITENCKLQIDNIKIRQESRSYIARIHRLNMDIERNNAYNLGCIAAKNEIIYGHPMHHEKYALRARPLTRWHPEAEHAWVRGYESGYHRFLTEYTELEMENKEADKEAFAELSEKAYTEDIEKANVKFKKVTEIGLRRKLTVKYRQFTGKSRCRK